MATRYSDEALRAISACSEKNRLNMNLWGMLCKFGISRTKPTRQGCRAGLRKQQLPRPPILPASSTPNGPPSCTLRSERDFISLSQDGRHLNISTWTTLNIQVNTLDAVRQIAQTTTPALTFCNRQHLHVWPNCERKNIPVRISQNGMTRNQNNAQIQPVLGAACKRIFLQSAGQTAKACRLASFYMVNTRSTKKTLDEFSAQLTTSGVDVSVITESWLHSYINSAYITIPGYVLYRKDRPNREGGGVCAFVTIIIPYKRRTGLEHPVFECMWLWLRPHRLPRPLSSIICGIVYSPEALAQENRDRLSYLIETLVC